MKLQPILIVCVLLALLPAVAMAQTANATMTGRVTDPTKALVIGARVTLINSGTNARFEATTNRSGNYVITAIPPGAYRAEVEKAGFRTIVETGIVLHTQDAVELNYEMAVGASSESVTVSASAGMAPIADSPSVGLLVNRSFVENTPLNGRSLQDLIALTPGVTYDNSQANAGLVSINGQRADANYFTVDGVSANTNVVTFNQANVFILSGDPRGLAGVVPAQTALGTTQSLLSIDSLQEFKVQTAGYSAENGRQPGGQIQLTSRSGTNDYHGSLYDYFRNEALDANSWLFNSFSPQIPRQPERQNDFGGTFGGPVYIPKIYRGRDKTFFFVGYEGLRLDLPSSAVLNVPTPAFRQFASPGWQTIMKSFSIPNGPDNGDPCAESLNPVYTFPCTAQWRGAFPLLSHLDSLNVRIDEVIGERLQAFFRYSYVPSTLNSDQPGNGSITNIATTQNVSTWTVGGTWRARQDLIGELRLNWTANSGRQFWTPTTVGGAIPFPLSFLVAPEYRPSGAAVVANAFMVIPDPVMGLLILESPTFNDARTDTKQFNLIDTWTWTRGRHSLKFGTDWRRIVSYTNTQGDYNLGLIALSAASIQQGASDLASISAGEPGHPTFNDLSAFVQDSWKWTSRLTLEYGLRWEFNPVPGASNGKYPLALTTGNVNVANLAPSGTPQYNTHYDKFAPRLGFVYQLNASQVRPLVIRGGFGVFYDTGQALGAGGYYGYPFVQGNVLFTSMPFPAPGNLVPPPDLNAPLVPPYGGFAGIAANDPALTLPYTLSWNLAASHGLSAGNTLTVTYVGNEGRKLLYTQDSGVCGSGTPLPGNPLFTCVQMTSNAASSSYEALQIQDQGRLLGGLELIASYTWAHALDNASSDALSAPPVRGNSGNDVRQVFNTALNWNIPGSSANRFAGALTRGWLITQRLTAQSGVPLTVFQGSYLFDPALQITGYIRPDIVPGEPFVLRNVPGDAFGWALNAAAFRPVPLNPDGSPVRQGNEPRNFIHGPGFWNLTTGLQRQFPFGDRVALLFRVEAFNILNHPNAGTPDNCLCDSTNFGKIFGGPASFGVPNQLYATGAARSLQLALKLSF